MIFQCFGPGQPEQALIPAAFNAARQGQDFPMTAGTQVRDFIYVDDVVAGLHAMTVAETLPAGDTPGLGTGVGTLPTRPGGRPQLIADGGRMQQFIDWRPQHTLQTGLQKALDLV